jgi:hypothetical protein
MRAKEAREITEIMGSKVADREVPQMIEMIKYAAIEGRNAIHATILSLKTKERLEEMGYEVFRITEEGGYKIGLRYIISW